MAFDLTTSQAATILTEMTESQPILSPGKSAASDDDEIPSSQPPAKKWKLSYAETDLNRLTYLQTRKVKDQKSQSHLREYKDKGTCPIGLQYRPKSHIRQDKDFQLAMNRICVEANQKLLALMTWQQEKNIQEDFLEIERLKRHLPNEDKAVKSALR